jgi:uncharacterized protein (DUF2235 family)
MPQAKDQNLVRGNEQGDAMKNIVLCADGTGNNDVKARGTNVFKLYEAIDRNGHKSNPALTPQVAFYDDGVGTSKFIPLRLLGGAVGWGFSRNVKDLYTELARAYELGDKIFLFGFSRGAYTVRTLAGLIQCCGILDVHDFDDNELGEAVENCWQEFRKIAFTRIENSDIRRAKTPTSMYSQENAKPRLEQNTQTRISVYKDVGIEFLGVWDTVSAIGAPTVELRRLVNAIYPLTFSELTVGPGVRKACHAISIDDERLTFYPELWNEQDGTDQRVLQVWFAGVHSNVGGGYSKHGMSLVALDWMMAEAQAQGLRFLDSDVGYVRTRHDPHDKLYNSRASLAVYYRWKPRSIVELCTKHRMFKPKIHISVFERIANGTDGYAPGNVPYDCDIVTTRSDQPEQAWPSGETLHEITSLVREGRRADSMISSLEENEKTVRSGQRSYRTFLTATFVVAFMSVFSFKTIPLNFADGSVQWDVPLWLVLLTALALVGSWVLVWSSRVDARLNSVYSRRWNKHRARLRQLLRTDKRLSANSQAGKERGAA